MNADANNVFEAQGKFLETIQDMIDHDEIDLDGDYLIGFETLVEQNKILKRKIEWLDAPPVPVQDSKVLHLNKKREE